LATDLIVYQVRRARLPRRSLATAGQPHSWVEQAHQPVLHHPDNGHGATVAKMRLQGARRLARKDVREGQVRLGGELLVQGLAALAPQVGMGVDSQ
jgi:hypothetical protein